MKHNRRMKKAVSLFLLMIMMISLLAGCSKEQESKNNTSVDSEDNELTVQEQVEPLNMPDIEWKTEAVEGETVTEVVNAKVTMDGSTATVEGEGAKVDGTTVTITDAGIYELTGTLKEGQLVIDTESEENVKIILNGVKITNSSSAAIYVISSPGKTILHCQSGSVNCLEDGETYTEQNTDGEPNATVFAKDDLKISGGGEIYITGNYGKGVSCKDDLEVKNASVYVNAVDDALRGKDSVTVEGAYLYLLAGADGIRTSNETDEGEGCMTITESECYITAGLDGIQAILDLTITDCTMGITTSGGYEGTTTTTSQTEETVVGSIDETRGITLATSGTTIAQGPGGGMPGGQGGMQGGMNEGNSNEYVDSCKGIKAGGNLTVSGGTYTINSYDDAFHCASILAINGGEYSISTGDDGFHADSILQINDGNITVSTCYEGLEAQEIYYNGGTTRITSTDDGLNGAGGNDESGMGGQWGDGFGGSGGTAIVELNDGYLLVDAEGDGLDSNGSLTMTGGTVIVYGPTNDGNGALDYDGSFHHEGGTLLTVGSSGMAQTVTSDYGVLAFTCGMNADTIMSLQDASGNIIFSFAAPKNYSCVVFASEELQTGNTYSVYADGSYDTQPVDGVYQEGSYSGGSLLGTLEAN